MKVNPLIFFGAGGRTRTGMELPPEDFESYSSRPSRPMFSST